jgi:hypothetical protein
VKVTRAGVDRSTDYLPEELSAISVILAAWDGEVGQGSIPVPDPAGNQEPYEGEQLLLEQDSLTIVDGFLGAVTSERGGTVTGTRRVHTMTLGDDNALLAGHATAEWIRPAEAPAARWAAFVTDFLPGGINTTWLLTTNESGITVPAKTYRTDSLFDDLSADTIAPTGKTVYIEGRRFHWHLPTEGQTCGLVIHDTNTPTSTSFQPITVNRAKDGMDLRNRIYARNDAGVVVSVTDATSISQHDSGGLKHQGYAEYGTETAAVMTRDIGVTLAERKDERVTWTYEIGPMTAAQAIQLIPGSQMTVTVGVHSLSAAVKRIARVTLSYRHGASPRRFTALVELGFPVRKRRKPTKTTSPADRTGGSGGGGTGGTGGTGGSGCGCPPWDFTVCTPSRETFSRTVSLGGWGVSEFTGSNWVAYLNGAVASVASGEAKLAPTGSFAVPSSATQENGPAMPAYPIHLRFKTKIAGPDGGGLSFIASEAAGGLGAAGSFFFGLEETVGGSPFPFRFQAIIHGAGGIVVGAFSNPFGATDPLGQWIWVEAILTAGDLSFRTWLDGGSVPSYTVFTLTGGDTVTLPTTLIITASTSATAGHTPETADWRFDIIELLCGTPPKGTEIKNEFVAVGDGVRSSFTLQNDYTPGSTHVEVDNIHHLVTETSPSTAAIDLGFAPIVGEVITASYQKG